MRFLSVAGRKAEDNLWLVLNTWLKFVSWSAFSVIRLAGVSSSSAAKNTHQIDSIAPRAPRS